ncbi:glycerophosphodiester phosphodiesterase family protein [Luteipulveratus flavus]|uniref:Glycerophosphodiester phosphodiesterase family protein n=1 Tax=Luteipulveratus flavus TaxID=3031728 RepID=A0ABT6CB52_9MICO|nr:glycerophosphodiester phosphodiesterase family protein [Luteipulveratus sp. YIM 133296]MDF8266114.1 glycerophosphodiester phosphodiesterase family protein [Luteipulveratus sp. YIM 133296]
MRRTLTALAAAGATALLAATTATASAAPADARSYGPPTKNHFDLQAHRGGIGMTTEETPQGFAKALELGVTTLELDTQVTKDRKVVVTHDRQVSGTKCQDTAPVTPGDPQFPYVGKYVKDLTLAQIKTMNCGFQQLPGFPEQEVVPGVRMAELKDVFAVVKRHRAYGVTLNIETKVEAGAPEQTAPRDVFVTRVYDEIARSGLQKQVTIQSFDWGSLMLMHRLAPRIPLVALTNYDFLQVGKPGASPWLGGIDADDFGGDFVAAADSIEGVTTLSPNYGFPQDGKIGQPGFRFYSDRSMIQRAHARGLKVVPWTCDDLPTIAQLMDWGVDGIITNYPNKVRDLMASRGMKLPKAYHEHPRP